MQLNKMYALNVSLQINAFFRLDCKVCISPAETNTFKNVTWSYNTIPSNEATVIKYGEHAQLSREDKVLHMKNLEDENTGLYLCKNGNTVTASYYLEVTDASEPLAKASLFGYFWEAYKVNTT